MRFVAFLLAVLGMPLFAVASGHGPLFGLATPTNSQGEWSFDEGVFGRATSAEAEASFRELVGYAIVVGAAGARDVLAG